jgi:excisionase family DNA binding protein
MLRGRQLEIFDQPGADVGRPSTDRPGRSNGSLMTAAEVADLLGVPASWVYEQSRRGQIPTVTLGRYRRYRRQAIEAWLEELEGGTPDGQAGPLAD